MKEIKFNYREPKIILYSSIYKPKKKEFLINIKNGILKNIDHLIKTITFHKEYSIVVQGYVKNNDYELLSYLNVDKIIITSINYKNEFNRCYSNLN